MPVLEAGVDEEWILTKEVRHLMSRLVSLLLTTAELQILKASGLAAN